MTEEEYKADKWLRITTGVSNNHCRIGLLWKDSGVTLKKKSVISNIAIFVVRE